MGVCVWQYICVNFGRPLMDITKAASITPSMGQRPHQNHGRYCAMPLNNNVKLVKQYAALARTRMQLPGRDAPSPCRLFGRLCLQPACFSVASFSPSSYPLFSSCSSAAPALQAPAFRVASFWAPPLSWFSSAANHFRGTRSQARSYDNLT